MHTSQTDCRGATALPLLQTIVYCIVGALFMLFARSIGSTWLFVSGLSCIVLTFSMRRKPGYEYSTEEDVLGSLAMGAPLDAKTLRTVTREVIVLTSIMCAWFILAFALVIDGSLLMGEHLPIALLEFATIGRCLSQAEETRHDWFHRSGFLMDLHIRTSTT